MTGTRKVTADTITDDQIRDLIRDPRTPRHIAELALLALDPCEAHDVAEDAARRAACAYAINASRAQQEVQS